MVCISRCRCFEVTNFDQDVEGIYNFTLTPVKYIQFTIDLHAFAIALADEDRANSAKSVLLGRSCGSCEFDHRKK